MSSNKTTPGSTTVKVSTITGAAKDEMYAGFNEDNASVDLNVLANDPGSAKIWSLDQNALSAPAGTQQPQNLNSFTLASGAVISLNADGTVHYEGVSALQSLAEGEVFNDSFIYTIRMANGALSTAKATVAITGVNDAATFDGDTDASMDENADSVSGILVVTDIDHDQSYMQADTQEGAFGTLTMAADGSWSYVRTSDMDYLEEGESVSDTFTVQSADGTEQVLTVNITGSDEVVVPNPSEKWVVTPQNVTREGAGLQARYVDGVAKLYGFDSNDRLHTTSLSQDAPFIQQIDTDGVNGVDSTQLNFSFSNNSGVEHVDVVLVGYLDFSLAQLFMAR